MLYGMGFGKDAMERITQYTLLAVLLGGTLFSWYHTALLFKKFFVYHDSLLQVTNCIVPNPIATPCFYGAVAFFGALVWAGLITYGVFPTSFVWLRRFLVFGILFAATVLVYEGMEFYQVIAPTVSVSCSPGTHPLSTPCFGGLLFFSAAYVIARVIPSAPKPVM